jgi:hypothetical protein
MDKNEFKSTQDRIGNGIISNCYSFKIELHISAGLINTRYS